MYEGGNTHPLTIIIISIVIYGLFRFYVYFTIIVYVFDFGRLSFFFIYLKFLFRKKNPRAISFTPDINQIIWIGSGANWAAIKIWEDILLIVEVLCILEGGKKSMF